MVFQPVLGSHMEFSHASTHFTRALEAVLWVFLLPTLGMHWKGEKKSLLAFFAELLM